MKQYAVRLVFGALCLALTGCIAMPTGGPVVEAEGGGDRSVERAADIDAQPPQAGASQAQLVGGFLDAMTAWPIQTSVAREYLSRDAAEQWNPDAGTIVYSDFVPPAETDDGVRVEFTTAERLDGSGGWRGALPADDLVLDLRVVRQDGEYRIANPPNALLVPTTWFQQRFRQVSLYFLDPVAERVVPEPVFVPIGAQLATSLVSALLNGPPEGLDGIVHSMIPAGLDVGLSVPVDTEGVARIDLVGDAPALAPEAVELLFAQLAWTLRQDPSITAFRVSVGGEEILPPGAVAPYDVEGAAGFDPAGAGASTLLYGLQDGALLSGTFDSLEAVSGAFGDGDPALDAVAVAPDGSTAAGVTGGRQQLVTASVQGDGTPALVIANGTNLRRPTWDAAGRLWVVDRTADGGRIVAVDEDGARDIEVPGVSGRNIRHLAVSRDGTRLTSVVRSEGRDEVLTSRVALSPTGRVERVSSTTVVRAADGQPVIDVAWSEPVAISLLTPATAGDLHEIATIPANGGFLEATDETVILRGTVEGIAAAPTPSHPLLAVRPDELVDVNSRESNPLADGVSQVDHAG